MTKLLSIFRRRHTPDSEALSAYVDGRLEPALARELEAHVAGCDACTTRLGELRQVRTMLSALGSVPVPRSFRLRQADVEAPARAPAAPATTYGSRGVLAFAPALSGVAVLLLGAVVWADMATRGDGSGTQLSMPSASAPERGMLTQDDAFDAADGAGAAEDGQPGTPAGQPAAGEVQPDTGGGTDAPPDTDAAAPGPIEESQAATRAAGDAGALTSSFGEEDDGGVRAGYLALEVALAALAIIAGGAFIYAWWRKREVA